MDKFSQLLSESSFSRLILGCESTSDFLLVEDRPWSDELQRDIRQRGLCWLGVIGIVNGQPRSALAAPMNAETIERLSQEFVHLATASTNAVEQLVAHLLCARDPERQN